MSACPSQPTEHCCGGTSASCPTVTRRECVGRLFLDRSLLPGPTDSMPLNSKSYGDGKETKGQTQNLSATATAAQLSASLSLNAGGAAETKDFNYGGTAAEYRSDAGVSHRHPLFACLLCRPRSGRSFLFRPLAILSARSRAQFCCAIASPRRTWRAQSRSRRCLAPKEASTTARFTLFR
jgi:hypothetical protein